jgi:hypothetical protein
MTGMPAGFGDCSDRKGADLIAASVVAEHGAKAIEVQFPTVAGAPAHEGSRSSQHHNPHFLADEGKGSGGLARRRMGLHLHGMLLTQQSHREPLQTPDDVQFIAPGMRQRLPYCVRG